MGVSQNAGHTSEGNIENQDKVTPIEGLLQMQLVKHSLR